MLNECFYCEIIFLKRNRTFPAKAESGNSIFTFSIELDDILESKLNEEICLLNYAPIFMHKCIFTENFQHFSVTKLTHSLLETNRLHKTRLNNSFAIFLFISIELFSPCRNG